MVDEKIVKDVVCNEVANGSVAGPSGWTGEMLRVVVLDSESVSGFTALINALIAGSFQPFPEARALLLCSHLVLRRKEKARAALKGGIRPVAMGEALWKVATACLRRLLGDKIHRLVGAGIQFGVSLPGGCQQAVLAIQNALEADPQHIAVLADIANAFNTRERADIVHELYSEAAAAPLYRVFFLRKIRFTEAACLSFLLWQWPLTFARVRRRWCVCSCAGVC